MASHVHPRRLCFASTARLGRGGLGLCVLVALVVGCGEAGAPVGIGAQECDSPPRLDLPFQYTLTAEAVEIATAGGGLRAWFSPWNPRAEPHSGHPENDFKSNWLGFWAPEVGDLYDPASPPARVACASANGSGCVSYAPDVDVEARIPDYISRDDRTRVVSVVLDSAATTPGLYYGTVNQWRVDARICDRAITYGHVGWIGDDLRARMLDAGYDDPNTVGPADVGRNLVRGDPIVMAAGERIARPQILRGAPVAGHPGYFTGPVRAQMEFPTYLPSGASESVFAWLSQETRAALYEVLIANMQNARHFVYATASPKWEWLWRAEATLERYVIADPEDYSSIFANAGEWTENDAVRGCTDPMAEDCNERLSIVPIVKDSPVYDSSLYGEAGYPGESVSYLMLSSLTRSGAVERAELLSPSVLDPVQGAFLVKWRMRDYFTDFAPPLYQAASYRLDEGERLLRIRWSGRSSSRSAIESELAALAAPASTDACDGVVLRCYAHVERRQGVP